MGRYAAREVFRWIAVILLTLVVASIGRQAKLIFVPGTPYQNLGSSFWNVFGAALRAPIQLLSHPYHAQLHQMLSHIPMSLFYVAYAFVFSYLFGVLKGMADVFWKRKPTYRMWQGLFWLLDAVPMFGLIVILECGTLYAAMAFKGDPLKMLPNQTFWFGDFIRANLLMWAPMMYISRLTSIAISFELGEDYLLTGRSKGLAARQLFTKHLYRNIVPKLLNESSTVFVMILSSLLALEYLSFQDHGFMFQLLAGMGQGEIGQETLFIDQGAFFVQTVVGYLLMIALFTGVFHAVAAWLRRRWKIVHNVEGGSSR